MWFFKKKSIVKTVLVGISKGISEDDALTNLAAGHMMGGFDGMVHAQLLNDSQRPTATFQVFYNNGTCEVVTVDIGSSQYNYYINFIE